MDLYDYNAVLKVVKNVHKFIRDDVNIINRDKNSQSIKDILGMMHYFSDKLIKLYNGDALEKQCGNFLEKFLTYCENINNDISITYSGKKELTRLIEPIKIKLKGVNISIKISEKKELEIKQKELEINRLDDLLVNGIKIITDTISVGENNQFLKISEKSTSKINKIFKSIELCYSKVLEQNTNYAAVITVMKNALKAAKQGRVKDISQLIGDLCYLLNIMKDSINRNLLLEKKFTTEVKEGLTTVGELLDDAQELVVNLNLQQQEAPIVTSNLDGLETYRAELQHDIAKSVAAEALLSKMNKAFGAGYSEEGFTENTFEPEDIKQFTWKVFNLFKTKIVAAQASSDYSRTDALLTILEEYLATTQEASSHIEPIGDAIYQKEIDAFITEDYIRYTRQTLYERPSDSESYWLPLEVDDSRRVSPPNKGIAKAEASIGNDQSIFSRAASNLAWLSTKVTVGLIFMALYAASKVVS